MSAPDREGRTPAQPEAATHGGPRIQRDAAAQPHAPSGTASVRVVRVSRDRRAEDDDRVAVEAPLEIQIHHPALGEAPVSFGTTMRTPGEDEWLAAGLLYGEGVIDRASDIEAVESSTRKPNVVNVRLNPRVTFDIQISARRFSAGSSCGVCGTTSLDAAIARAATARISSAAAIDLEVLVGLPQRMRESQSKFGDTGGIHASALFDLSGSLLGIAEDVGRHNAFDKLVGENLLAGRLPLERHVALLSGRASFELVQKALRAGVAVLAAIGAPSSIAVSLARTSGLTLIGFLRESRCNVYSNPERLLRDESG
jgi:FdhD protein